LAVIQQVQHHPLSPDIVHMDFHAISADEVIHAQVSVETTGEPVGVKTFGGLLEIQLHSVEVECLPKDLPDIITIDVSALNVSDAVHVRDLVLPAGVKARLDGDVTILRVSSPTGDVKASEDAPTQPEVLREKKADAEKK
jgi:large subunit ribosomal protein L25